MVFSFYSRCPILGLAFFYLVVVVVVVVLSK